MKQYVVDYEFTTPGGQYYWLPLALHAVNGRKARQIAERFEHGLSEKYNAQMTGPYVVGSYAGSLLQELRNGRNKGKPEFLEVIEHCLRLVEFDSEMTFDEHVNLSIQAHGSPYPDEPEVIASVKHRTIPVRLIEEGDLDGIHSLLVINIISPDVPDQPRSIPAESKVLGSVLGTYFCATIYQTPEDEIAVLIDISDLATPFRLNKDRMNTKIYEKSVELTGDYPDFYVQQVRKL